MKYFIILVLLTLGACSDVPVVTDPVEAAIDHVMHEEYLESIHNLDNYDPEYVDDCLYYEDVVCEFE